MLFVKISYVLYLVTADVLHHVFSLYGFIEKIDASIVASDGFYGYIQYE